jgi:hypothetical protein
MTRDDETQLLDFCVVQRRAFDVADWERFTFVSHLELAAVARYLAGVDWFGHQADLTKFADNRTSLNFEELTQVVDFEPSRFRGMFHARLSQTA